MLRECVKVRLLKRRPFYFPLCTSNMETLTWHHEFSISKYGRKEERKKRMTKRKKKRKFNRSELEIKKNLNKIWIFFLSFPLSSFPFCYFLFFSNFTHFLFLSLCSHKEFMACLQLIIFKFSSSTSSSYSSSTTLNTLRYFTITPLHNINYHYKHEGAFSPADGCSLLKSRSITASLGAEASCRSAVKSAPRLLIHSHQIPQLSSLAFQD